MEDLLFEILRGAGFGAVLGVAWWLERKERVALQLRTEIRLDAMTLKYESMIERNIKGMADAAAANDKLVQVLSPRGAGGDN